MITDKDKQELGDLVFRALDTIENDYGEDAELAAACIVFEVKVKDGRDGDYTWHGNYKSLRRNSPNHIGGILRTAAEWMTMPCDADDCDHE